MLTPVYTGPELAAPAQEAHFISKARSSSLSPDTARVDILKADISVGRKTSTSSVATTPMAPPIRTAGSTKGMSRKSRRRMALVVRNVEGFTHFATLNYASIAPDDDRVAKKHLDRIKTWLTRRGVKLLWKLEFSPRRGRPHFHLLMVGDVDVNALKTQWKKIIGADDTARYLVDDGPIRNEEHVYRYTMKRRDSPTNRLPAHYKNAGRMWGTAGGLKPTPLATYEGTLAELAPILRVLTKIAKLRLVLNRHRRDRGVTSMTLWATGGCAVAAAVERYWRLLHSQEPITAALMIREVA